MRGRTRCLWRCRLWACLLRSASDSCVLPLFTPSSPVFEPPKSPLPQLLIFPSLCGSAGASTSHHTLFFGCCEVVERFHLGRLDAYYRRGVLDHLSASLRHNFECSMFGMR